jgi:hypothetical protein
MDLTVLSRKISSYRTPKGQIRSLPHELLGEILHAWEQWSGAPSAFYKVLGVDYRKMGSLMGKAKQLKRDGAFDGLNFTEVIIAEDSDSSDSTCPPNNGCSIELVYKNNVIRFGNSDLLLDFLKKAA